MHRVWLGHQSFADALSKRQIELDGARELVKAFPDWLALSHFASVKGTYRRLRWRTRDLPRGAGRHGRRPAPAAEMALEPVWASRYSSSSSISRAASEAA